MADIKNPTYDLGGYAPVSPISYGAVEPPHLREPVPVSQILPSRNVQMMAGVLNTPPVVLIKNRLR